MVTVKRDAPLGALERQFFLAGILVDPYSVEYEIRTPAAAVATDEDGDAVTGREPIRVGLGRYHAGNTILGQGAAVGTYEIEWTYQKLAASPALTATDSFEVVAEFPEDQARDADNVTRQDVVDTTNVRDLRVRINDYGPDPTKWAFFNSELQAFLDRAIAQHTEGKRTESTATVDDVSMAMLLAHCSAARALAMDKVRFFRWQDGNESVDKSMVPRALLDVCASLLQEYRTIRKQRADEKEAGVQDRAPTGDRMEFRPRRRR